MRHPIVFWHSLFLVSLIIFIALVTFFRRNQWSHKRSNDRDDNKGTDRFPHKMITSLKGIRLELAWKVNWTGRARVDFQVTFSGRPSSILVGFSDHGKIEGSDFCLYWPNESQKMMDGWVDRRWKLRRDMQQNCELIRTGTNRIEFGRKLATCDPRDYRIEKGTSNILLAVSTRKRTKSLADPNMAYQMRFTQLLVDKDESDAENDHLGGTPAEKSHNLFTLDIRAQNVTIPAQETTYWCAIVELSETLKRHKHHAIRYEAIISPGNAKFVHHFEVFHCQQKTRPFTGDCSEDKPLEARSCSKVLAAWAMGANPIVYPPEAGMPLGGVGFVPFLMVEIHYNNVQKVAGIRDSSGLRITYTDKLRPNDAGIMELGLIYSDANSIPPDQPHFPITGFCPAECTQKFPIGGIFIFASQLHSHLTGRKLHSSVIRGGSKVTEINRDDHYSPHWQHIRSLRPFVHIRRGDVISTTCVYETRGRKHWTWGGYGIEDEMCVNYVHYYPASEVEVCKQMNIHEKYSAVKWTMAKFASLRELYAVAPLNVACLQHSGDLFPDHPTNWSRVPRPEYGTESSTNEGQSNGDECLALND
ncbi:hypothetical protein niasHT_007780 [Heterodera trifolii]|uniref:Tyramine beta-hydroxylase n=1 Tax=Heterodera trifolii TaxID=157864 RepID=A0ABD2LKK4_9BILA